VHPYLHLVAPAVDDVAGELEAGRQRRVGRGLVRELEHYPLVALDGGLLGRQRETGHIRTTVTDAHGVGAHWRRGSQTVTDAHGVRATLAQGDTRHSYTTDNRSHGLV